LGSFWATHAAPHVLSVGEHPELEDAVLELLDELAPPEPPVELLDGLPELLDTACDELVVAIPPVDEPEVVTSVPELEPMVADPPKALEPVELAVPPPKPPLELEMPAVMRQPAIPVPTTSHVIACRVMSASSQREPRLGKNHAAGRRRGWLPR
jgi:hypothetical protein